MNTIDLKNNSLLSMQHFASSANSSEGVPRRCFVKKMFLKNFVKFTGKHQRLSPF